MAVARVRRWWWKALLGLALLMPVALFGVAMAIGELGGRCDPDFLDNPDWTCNRGGEVGFILFLLGYLTLPLAAVALLISVVLVARHAWTRRSDKRNDLGSSPGRRGQREAR